MFFFVLSMISLFALKLIFLKLEQVIPKSITAAIASLFDLSVDDFNSSAPVGFLSRLVLNLILWDFYSSRVDSRSKRCTETGTKRSKVSDFRQCLVSISGSGTSSRIASTSKKFLTSLETYSTVNPIILIVVIIRDYLHSSFFLLKTGE